MEGGTVGLRAGEGVYGICVSFPRARVLFSRRLTSRPDPQHHVVGATVDVNSLLSVHDEDIRAMIFVVKAHVSEIVQISLNHRNLMFVVIGRIS